MVRAAVAAVMVGAMALTAAAQYPGQLSKKSTEQAPELRAIAVLEWTGEAGKPKACRIVPVAIYDGDKLQDGGLYLARPEPLAVADEVEYELRQNGHAIGLFEVKNAGQEQGSWVGYGEWKGMPKPKEETAQAPAKIDDGAEDDDKPTLHRKHSGDKSGKSGDTDGTKPADDPDRPKLHKHPDEGSGSDTAQTAPDDPDRPVMKKPKKEKAPEDVGHVNSLPEVTDPDRPRLKRGLSNADSLKVVPSLMGLPADMQQMVAVSDSKTRPEHPWGFTWANPDDEKKMKGQMEEIARQALGIAQPAPAARKAVAKTPGNSAVARKKAAAAPPPEPAPLEDEKFRVFELAYGSGATMVLSAKSGTKFVTLIAQPDLYGNVMVLLKSATDAAHLDETPMMRLVDAVDAQADNRGELLFEMRGDTSRSFALYRVVRGRAEKLFASYGAEVGRIAE